MNERKLQVFISSTYEDMKAERQAAVEVILQAGHIPAGMELFSAGDESQLETIRRWIDESDVFLLILGGRYGSIEPKSKKSYIQLEYEYAIERAKPHFAIVAKDNVTDAKLATLKSRAIETDNKEKLEKFKKTVMSKICRLYCDTAELKLYVFEKLSEVVKHREMTGWVRDTAPTKASLLQDLYSVQKELREANSKLEELKKNSSSAWSVISLMDDLYESFDLRSEAGDKTLTATYYDVFLELSPLATRGGYHWEVSELISNYMSAQLGGDYSISSETHEHITIEFAAIGLIRIEERERNVFWIFTQAGLALFRHGRHTKSVSKKGD